MKIYKEEFVPIIKKSQSISKFKNWIYKKNVYTIIILDVSGSMETEYESLVEMTNNIISSQRSNEESEGIIILFSSHPKTYRKGNYNKLLDIKEVRNNGLAGGKDLLKDLKELKNIYTQKKNSF